MEERFETLDFPREMSFIYRHSISRPNIVRNLKSRDSPHLEKDAFT